MSRHSSVTGSVEYVPVFRNEVNTVTQYGLPESALGNPGGKLPPGGGLNVSASGTSSSVGPNVTAGPVAPQDHRETPIVEQGPRDENPDYIPPAQRGVNIPSGQSGDAIPPVVKRVDFVQPVVTGSSVPSLALPIESGAGSVSGVKSQSTNRVPGLACLPHRSDTIKNGVGHEAVSIGNALDNRIDPGLTEPDRLRLVDTDAALNKADSDRQALATQNRALSDRLLTKRSKHENQITDLGPVLTEISNMRPHVTSADAQECVVSINKQADIVANPLYGVNSQLRLARYFRNMNHVMSTVFRQPLPRPNYPWDKGISIIRGLKPTSSRETVFQELIPNPYARTAPEAAALFSATSPATSGQRGHTEHTYTGSEPQLFSQHTLGQTVPGGGLSGAPQSQAGQAQTPYPPPGLGNGLSGVPPYQAGQNPLPYQPVGPDPGLADQGYGPGVYNTQTPRPDQYAYDLWRSIPGGPPPAEPTSGGEHSRPVPGGGSYGSRTTPLHPGSTSQPSNGRPAMPNNHINNPWYYYGSQPIAELASAADELRKSAQVLQRLPVVSELDKPPPGARNVTLKPYHSGKNIRHWFVEFEVYLCMIRCFNDDDKILQLHYLMSPHNFTFLETLSSEIKNNYETFKAALIDRYKDKQLDNDKLRQTWLIHQDKNGHESVDTYYERLETALVDALPEEHINTNKVYITLFESNLRPDIYCKYRDMTTGVVISTMETARSYAINCEQLLKSHEYMEGVRMHQRSISKSLADHRVSAMSNSARADPRDRDGETGRYVRRESLPLPSVLRPSVRFRSRSPESEPPRARSPHISVAAAAPAAPKPYSIHPRPPGGNRPPSSQYPPPKINVPYRDLKPSSRVFTHSGIPRATHNGVTVGLGDALWNRWCKDHPPQEDRAVGGRPFEQAVEKYNMLNRKTTESQTGQTPVKVVDPYLRVNVIAPEYENQEENYAWTEELVQEALALYGMEPEGNGDLDASIEYVDVTPNPPGGDF